MNVLQVFLLNHTINGSLNTTKLQKFVLLDESSNLLTLFNGICSRCWIHSRRKHMAMFNTHMHRYFITIKMMLPTIECLQLNFPHGFNIANSIILIRPGKYRCTLIYFRVPVENTTLNERHSKTRPFLSLKTNTYKSRLFCLTENKQIHILT